MYSQVVCRNLGYTYGEFDSERLSETTLTNAVHTSFLCKGHEKSLLDCPRTNLYKFSLESDPKVVILVCEGTSTANGIIF